MGAYKIAVLLRRYPNMAVAPSAQTTELLDFGMRMLRVVLDGQAHGIVDADVAAEPEEYASRFQSEEL